MTGAPHNPTFTMTCTIWDFTFSGTGHSKKEAKLAASHLALQEMRKNDFSQNQNEMRLLGKKYMAGRRSVKLASLPSFLLPKVFQP